MMKVTFIAVLFFYALHHTTFSAPLPQPALPEDIFNQSLSKESGFIAYDCTYPGDLIEYSEEDNDDCKDEIKKRASETVEGQLFFEINYDVVEFEACYIKISVVAVNCREWIHHPLLLPPETNFVKLPREQCKKVIDNNVYRDRIYDFEIEIVNGRGYAEGIRLAGEDDSYGQKCEGSSYTMYNGTHIENAIAYAQVEVRTVRSKAEYNIKEQTVKFYDGAEALYRNFEAFHYKLGYVTWSPFPSNGPECSKNFVEIFKGNFLKTIETMADGRNRTSYSYEGKDRNLFVVAGNEGKFCDEEIFETQLKGLFLLEKTSTSNFIQFNKDKINSHNFDDLFITQMQISSYDNHLGHQINRLKEELMQEICINRKRSYINQFKKKEGYLTIESGEILYVKKCAPVIVTFRSTNKCYQDIPVTYKNQNYYVQPTTKILSEDGSQTHCSVLAPKFKIENQYYKILNGHLIPSDSPHFIMNPNLNWSYEYSDKKLSFKVLTSEQQIKLDDFIRHQLSKDPIQQAAILSHQGIERDVKYQEAEHISHSIEKLKGVLEAFGLGFLIDWAEELKLFVQLIAGCAFAFYCFQVVNSARKIVKEFGLTWQIIYAFRPASTARKIQKAAIKKMEDELENRIKLEKIADLQEKLNAHPLPTAPINCVNILT
jgi:hypothetical protein